MERGIVVKKWIMLVGICLFSASGIASQISFKGLPEALKKSNCIITARVLDAETSGKNEITGDSSDEVTVVSVRNEIVITALMIAAEYDDTELVKELLNKGADIDERALLGMGYYNIEVAKLLLEAEVDVNIHTDDGWTPLLFSVNNGNNTLFKLLLEKGADLGAKTVDGRTALMIASEKGHTEIERILINKGAADGRIDDLAVKSMIIMGVDDSEILRKMLDGESDVADSRISDGWTALMFAVATNYFHAGFELMEADPEITNLLIEGGAVVDARTIDIAERKTNTTKNNAIIMSLKIRYAKAGNADENDFKQSIFEKGESFKILSDHAGPVNTVTFSADGKMLASGGYDHTVRLWDVVTGNELQKFEGHTEIVSCVTFSPDEKTLASAAADKTIRLWDMDTGKVLQIFVDRRDWICGVNIAISPDGKILASAGSDTIGLWDIATGKEIRRIKGPEAGVSDVDFSPDGKTLASACIDGTIRLWEVVTGKELWKLKRPNEQIFRVIYPPDGKILAAAAGGTIYLLDADTGKLIREINSPGLDICFSPDGRILASGFYEIIHLWDVSTGNEVHRLNAHKSMIFSIAFSPDRNILASGGEEPTIFLWNLSDM